jgi:hypothetical protein
MFTLTLLSSATALYIMYSLGYLRTQVSPQLHTRFPPTGLNSSGPRASLQRLLPGLISERQNLKAAVRRKPITVSADRVKPAYIFNEDDCGITTFKLAKYIFKATGYNLQTCQMYLQSNRLQPSNMPNVSSKQPVTTFKLAKCIFKATGYNLQTCQMYLQSNRLQSFCSMFATCRKFSWKAPTNGYNVIWYMCIK